MRSEIRHLLYIASVLLVLFSLNGCKKSSDSPKESETTTTTAQQTAANDSAAAPENAQDLQVKPNVDAAEMKKCEKWGNNPIFMDGQEFIYDTKIETHACCDLDKDDPSWKCDDTGSCAREISFEIKCKATLTNTEPHFCASSISCTTDSKYESELMNFRIAGGWFIDSNGIYHLEEAGEEALGLNPAPGNCKNIKYIQCIPETLAYEYTNFQDDFPLIPFGQSEGVHEGDCEEDAPVCDSLEITHQGSIWERIESVEGGDSSTTTIALDEKRGVIRYETMFSGGMERTLTATLK